MSRRPYDPFSPLGNWSDLVDDTPPDQGPDNEEVITPVEDLLGLVPLTGDAAPRTPDPDPTPVPEPEAPVKPARARRTRRPRKAAPDKLEDALARLDEAKR